MKKYKNNRNIRNSTRRNITTPTTKNTMNIPPPNSGKRMNHGLLRKRLKSEELPQQNDTPKKKRPASTSLFHGGASSNQNKISSIELFVILGKAITDSDYDEDSRHDELLGGTANEDKAIEQCHTFDFIIGKSQFCVSDIDYKIKENQDDLIEIFDDSIMIFDAGPGIIKPLKYDPWLSRQKATIILRKHIIHYNISHMTLYALG